MEASQPSVVSLGLCSLSLSLSLWSSHVSCLSLFGLRQIWQRVVLPGAPSLAWHCLQCIIIADPSPSVAIMGPNIDLRAGAHPYLAQMQVTNTCWTEAEAEAPGCSRLRLRLMRRLGATKSNPCRSRCQGRAQVTEAEAVSGLAYLSA